MPYSMPYNDDGSIKKISQMTPQELNESLAEARRILSSPTKSFHREAFMAFAEHWCEMIEQRISELKN